jgi:hypothetical protein
MAANDDGKLAAAAAEVALDLAGVPGAGSLVGLVADLVGKEHHRRQSVALRTAEQLSGLSREELADVLRSSRPAVNATVAFLFAVGEAGDDEVLEMIGATLAQALRGASEDPRSPLSEEQLVLRALRGLTSDHVRLMVSMREFEPERAMHNDNPISGDQLRDRGIVPGRLLTSLLAYLEFHGLTENPHGRWLGGTFWELSELGRLVLRAGDEAASRK